MHLRKITHASGRQGDGFQAGNVRGTRLSVLVAGLRSFGLSSALGMTGPGPPRGPEPEKSMVVVRSKDWEEALEKAPHREQ